MERFLSYFKEEDGSLAVFTDNQHVLLELSKTGAVVEKGIAFNLYRSRIHKEAILPDSRNSIVNFASPYINYGHALFPMLDNDQIIKLYQDIKYLSTYQEKFDLRKIETLVKKIKFIYDHSVDDKEEFTRMWVFLWTALATANVINGDPALALFLYLGVFGNLNHAELYSIVRSSTMSEERKAKIIDDLQKYNINPELIKEKLHFYYYLNIAGEDSEKELAREVLNRYN